MSGEQPSGTPGAPDGAGGLEVSLYRDEHCVHRRCESSEDHIRVAPATPAAALGVAFRSNTTTLVYCMGERDTEVAMSSRHTYATAACPTHRSPTYSFVGLPR